MKLEALPKLSPVEVVHREMLKAVGPLKSYKKKARETLKKMTRLHLKLKNLDTDANKKEIRMKYKQFGKHRDHASDLFINPALDNHKFGRFFKKHNHPSIKKEKHMIMLKKAQGNNIKL